MEEWMKVMVRSKSVSPLYFIILILEVLNVLDMSHLTIFVMVCISQCNVNDMIFFLPSPSRTLDFRFCWLWTSQWKNRVRRGHKKLHCVPFQTNNNNNNKQFQPQYCLQLQTRNDSLNWEKEKPSLMYGKSRCERRYYGNTLLQVCVVKQGWPLQEGRLQMSLEEPLIPTI